MLINYKKTVWLCIACGLIIGCADVEGKIKKRTGRYGFCVGTEGARLIHKTTFSSRENLLIDEKRDMLMRDIRNYSKLKNMDANYYIETQEKDHSLKIFGYSILNNALRVILKTDTKYQHIVYIKYFYPSKKPVECFVSYDYGKQKVIITKSCSNNTKRVLVYSYQNSNNKGYNSLINDTYYDKGRLIRRTRLKNGKLYYEDKKSGIAKYVNIEASFSDFCIPYVMYDPNKGSNIGL